ncbi:MAG: peptide ABC transporter substrate-binding protein [Pseudomonadota bacterium]
MSRRCSSMVAVLLSTSLLSGCGSDSSSDDEPPTMVLDQPVELIWTERGRPDPSVLADQQVLHRGNSEEPQTLDPHLASGVATANLLRDLFEGLTTTSPNGDIVPGAAGRWDISRDGITYTFYLRPEGRWSNGEPLTADDFVYSFRRAVDPDTAASYGRMLVPIQNAPAILAGELPPDQLGVEALNERTVQITLADPTPYFLGLLTHATTYPVYQPAIEMHGDAHVRPGNLVSNGAFRLHEWQPRSEIVLLRNPYFHADQDTILDQVIYYPIEDENTEFQRFRAGGLDWTFEVPSNQFRWLEDNLSDALLISPWFGTYFFSFNLTREPFIASLELRQALNLAINRDILTEKVSQFGEIPTFNLIPPDTPDFPSPIPEAAAWTQQEREVRARELYQAAGYSLDQPLDVELRYNTSENHRKLAVSVAAMWKAVLGVRTRLVNEEFRVFLQNRALRRNTEVFRAGWIGDYQDPFTFLELFHSAHGRNDAGYNNPRYDRLLEQISTERIPARRRNLMVEAERMLLADQVVLPVYVYVTKRLIRPTLKGWQPNIMDFHLSRYLFFVRTNEATEPEPAEATALPSDADTELESEPSAAGDA